MLLGTNKKEENEEEGKKGWVLDNRYRVGEQLGKGSYGVVYRAVDGSSKQVVAVKEFVKGNLH